MDALFLEIGERFGRVFADGVLERNREQRCERRQRFLLGNGFRCIRDEQHARAGGDGLFEIFRQRMRAQPLRRADDERTDFRECHRTPLALRRKRDLLCGRKAGILREIGGHGLERRVVIVRIVQKGTHPFLDGHGAIPERPRRDDAHLPFRNRAGFIEAKRIDMGEHFEGIEVLDEDFLFGEARHADGEADAD